MERRVWSRFCPQSLAGQLIAVLVITLLATQFLGFVIFSDERRSVLEAVNRDNTVSRTASIVRVLAATPDGVHEEVVDAATSRELRFWLDDEPVVQVDADDFAEKVVARRLRRSIDLPEENDILVDLSALEARFHHHHDHDDHHDRDDDDDEDEDDDRRWRHWHGPASVLISIELADGQWFNAENVFRGPQRERRPRTWISLTIAILIVSVVSVVMLRRITRPMKALADAANRLGRGEVVDPIPERGPREARATTHAFNEMRERLKRFIDDRTHMLAATGHDLRTPLTSLRLRAELVEDEELRAHMLRTLDEMQRMVEAMLDFARDDAASEETRDVDLNALIGSICDDLSDMALPVSFAAGPGTTLRCRPFALSRALRNLIENGARHGGGATVKVDATDGEVRIVIEDDGPGIADAQLQHVFDPFVRLDSARGQETGGMGLGLGIARSIVHAHGGDISIVNRETGGLRVVVTIPRQ